MCVCVCVCVCRGVSSQKQVNSSRYSLKLWETCAHPGPRTSLFQRRWMFLTCCEQAERRRHVCPLTRTACWGSSHRSCAHPGPRSRRWRLLHRWQKPPLLGTGLPLPRRLPRQWLLGEKKHRVGKFKIKPRISTNRFRKQTLDVNPQPMFVETSFPWAGQGVLISTALSVRAHLPRLYRLLGRDQSL